MVSSAYYSLHLFHQQLQPYTIKVQMNKKQSKQSTHNKKAQQEYFGVEESKSKPKIQARLTNKKSTHLSNSKQQLKANPKSKTKTNVKTRLKTQSTYQNRQKAVIYSKSNKNTQKAQSNFNVGIISKQSVWKKLPNNLIENRNQNLRHCHSQHSLNTKSALKQTKQQKNKLFLSGRNQKTQQNRNFYQQIVKPKIETSSNINNQKKYQWKANLSFFQHFSQHSFNDTQKMKLQLFGFVLKYRIIKDQQFEQIYKKLLSQFPSFEQQIKDIMVDILTTLDV